MAGRARRDALSSGAGTGARESVSRLVLGAWGLLAASHPCPIATVVSLTALVALVSTGGHPPAERAVLVVLAMLLSQLSIGWTNDYLDREHDAVHQPDKPIASGAIDARVLPPAIVIALTAVFALGVVLGPLALVLLAVGTSAGFIYNFVLQDTRFSWLPYVLGFAVLPPFVWVSLDAFHTDFLFLYLVAAPLVIAAHLANSLPDVDSDRAAGHSGLAARLGTARSLALLAACVLLPLALVALSTAWLSYDLRPLAITIAVYSLLLVGAAFSYRSASADNGFRFTGLAAIVFVAGWLFAV